jgi:hypothetical protein
LDNNLVTKVYRRWRKRHDGPGELSEIRVEESTGPGCVSGPGRWAGTPACGDDLVTENIMSPDNLRAASRWDVVVVIAGCWV